MLFQLFKHLPIARDFRIMPVSGGAAIAPDALLERIVAAANQLRTCGVARGERVAFCGDQGLPAYIAFWATIAAGAAFAPIDPSLPIYAHRMGLKKIKPRLLIVEDPIAEANREDLAAEIKILRIDGDGRFHDTPPAASFEPDELSGQAPAACILTSGSTAEPKVVVLSHAALRQSAKLVVQSFGWKTGERLLNLPDPHTMSGLRNAFLAAPIAGMHWVCAPRRERLEIFSLLDILQRVQAERIVAAPLLLRHINLLGDRVNAATFESTVAVYCTGTDLHVAEVEQFHRRFQKPVINYYGLTESAGLCLTQQVSNWRPDDPSIGFPVGCDIRLVDENQVEVAEGASGELQVRQDLPMNGYLNDELATAERFVEGWLKTGDLACRQPDGRIVIVGRSGTFIKTRTTERINPQEIEAVLEQHHSIAEAAVCGIPDLAGGERIAALVVPKKAGEALQSTPAELAGFVAEHLGSARAPTLIRFASAIPRTANGKIIRTQLRAQFSE